MANFMISKSKTTDTYLRDLSKGLEPFDKPVKPDIAGPEEPVINLKCEVKRLWIEACRYDGIDPDAQFVNFSSSNPYSGLYNIAMSDYLAGCLVKRS